MNRKGVYVLANDKVIEQTTALLNSIRAHDPGVEIALIPYDDNYLEMEELSSRNYGVQIFPNLDLLEKIDQLSAKTWNPQGKAPWGALKMLRKFACWFGDFDEFAYIDTDIVMLESISNYFTYFEQADFINNDFQANTEIQFIFREAICEDPQLATENLSDVFNAGLFCSKKGLISYEQLEQLFHSTAQQPDSFYAEYIDQSLLNYWLLQNDISRLNLTRVPERGSGSWGGTQVFEYDGDILMDPRAQKPVSYLHWAGLKLEPGCPNWSIWEQYRRISDINYRFRAPQASPNSWFTRLKAKVKRSGQQIRNKTAA